MKTQILATLVTTRWHGMADHRAYPFLQATECSTAVAGSAYLNIGTKLQLPEPDDVAEDDSDAIAEGGRRTGDPGTSLLRRWPSSRGFSSCRRRTTTTTIPHANKLQEQEIVFRLCQMLLAQRILSTLFRCLDDGIFNMHKSSPLSGAIRRN